MKKKNGFMSLMAVANCYSERNNWNEHYDGSGFPGELKGDAIPIGTAILVAINAYFALISPRPYRKAYSQKEALKILEEGAGKKWNPKVIKILKEII